MSCNCNTNSAEIFGSLATYSLDDLIEWAIFRGVKIEDVTSPKLAMDDLTFEICSELKGRIPMRDGWLDYCNHVAGEIIC